MVQSIARMLFDNRPLSVQDEDLIAVSSALKEASRRGKAGSLEAAQDKVGSAECSIPTTSLTIGHYVKTQEQATHRRTDSSV